MYSKNANGRPSSQETTACTQCGRGNVTQLVVSVIEVLLNGFNCIDHAFKLNREQTTSRKLTQRCLVTLNNIVVDAALPGLPLPPAASRFWRVSVWLTV